MVTVFTAFISLRYLLWRLTETVIPFMGSGNEISEMIWVGSVFFFETLMFIEMFIFLLIMSKYNDRHLVEHKPMAFYPTVDIFIPTYDEPIDVLEKTIIGARNIDYPNFKVWVLDDGKRDWLKDYCEEKGVNYLIREDNSHAKAGNMNNGLKHASGDFVAIFDADFVPNRNFLKKTVPYFDDESIGIVQTPQTFFNKDPIQTNLNLHMEMPDEQRLFFEEMAPARDGWDAAFCCGSCSIVRRKALDEIDGFPTESITEDLLTTLSLLNHGYRTIYHNETLSRGLASESTEGYFVQRERWCQGGIQCMLLKNGPLRMKGLSLFQRLLFLPYGWIVQPLGRLFILLVPLVYLWYGLSPIQFVTTENIIDYFVPMFVILTLSNLWLTGRKYYPLLNTAVGIFSTFRLLLTVIQTLIKPFGRPFKVTPKGSNNDDKPNIEVFTLVCSLVFFFLTVLGIVINTVPELAILDDVEFFPYAVIWGTMNLIYLFISILLCFDFTSQRKEERFDACDYTLFVNNNEVNMKDVSVNGFSSEKIPDVEKNDYITVTLFNNDADKSMTVTGRVVNSRSLTAVNIIHVGENSRDRMIEVLFSGDFDKLCP